MQTEPVLGGPGLRRETACSPTADQPSLLHTASALISVSGADPQARSTTLLESKRYTDTQPHSDRHAATRMQHISFFILGSLWQLTQLFCVSQTVAPKRRHTAILIDSSFTRRRRMSAAAQEASRGSELLQLHQDVPCDMGHHNSNDTKAYTLPFLPPFFSLSGS
jgi:hypothetical protein